VAGTVNNNNRFALARYNTDGTLDTTFDVDGMLTNNFGSYANGNSVTVQTDGKILVAGMADGDFALARYNTDGTLDTTFDSDGMLTTDFGSNANGNSVTVQADGKILVAGSANNSFALARYNTNGTLDTAFDTDGMVTNNFGSFAYGRSVTIQADGKILVAGTADGSFALARYNANGTLDTTFDTDGMVTTSFSSYGEGYSVTIQADGKILVAGATEPNTYSSALALARYNTNGSLDTSFATPNNTLNGSPVYTEGQDAVVLDSDVRVIDTQLDASGNYNGATLTLSRHNGTNAQDVFTAKSGGKLTTLTAGSYFSVDGVTIGRVDINDAGTLTVSFNANATQLLVSKAMQQIAYANTSDAPPASVQIDWTFNDGNTGSQGTGGALSVTGSTTVQITAVNDAPYLVNYQLSQSVTANRPFSYTVPIDTFIDQDAETLRYTMGMADGTGVPPWLSFNTSTRTFSGTPSTSDVGSFDIRVNATDGSNSSASDVFTITVLPPDTTAPTVTSFSPTDGATDVPATDNIVLTFDEGIQRGTGNIVLKTVAGATIETFNAASSNRLSISDSTLTINPTADLASGTSYKVDFAAGSIKDLAGNNYAGTTSYDFTTDLGIPVLSTIQTEFSFEEGNSGFTIAPIILTLSHASSGNVVVHYTVRSGMANVGTPYEADVVGSVGGNLFFDPGVTSQIFNATIWADTQPEPDEYFWVDFDNILFPQFAKFKDGAASITAKINIIDDDTDRIAPVVISSSPTDDATNVLIGTNIILTFSEPIQIGTGNIFLKNTAGTIIETYDSATSGNLTISGPTLTIDPTITLDNNTKYYVIFETGTIKDLAGNSYSGTTSYKFTTVPDTTAPTVSSFSPMDGATGVPATHNIVLAFNEAIVKGTGNIVLKTAAGVTIESFDAATSGQLSISGVTMTIDPTSTLAYSTNYFVTFEAGTIKDLAGNAYNGTTSYDFTTVPAPDITGPMVSSFNPADGATTASTTANIVVTLNEAIQRGTGNIILKTAAGVTVETFDAATSSHLSISGSTLTIDPTSALVNGTHYYLALEAGTVKDIAGNIYTGATTYDFTTIQSFLSGTGGNDALTGGPGDDIFNGGDGVDTIILSGLPSQYRLNGTSLSGIEGTDTLSSIEQHRFGSLYVSNLNASALTDPDGEGPADSPAKDMLQGISDLYVAYFNRAPDVDGLMYWFREVMNGSTWTLPTIAQSFTDQAEYRETYPPGLSNREFISAIYQNLFDRAPDAAGWDYWENDLNHGVPRDVFIYSIIQGAYAPSGSATDRALLNNKHDVSLYYSEQLATSEEAFDETSIDQLLNRVTDDAQTVVKAEAVIDYVIDNTVTLTGLITDTPAAWEAFWV